MPRSLSNSSFAHSEAHLRVEGLSFSFTDRRVLTDISFTIPAGDRVGLIGENGSGKSTLLHVIAGHLSPSVGKVVVNSSVEASIGLLHQEPPFELSDSIGDAMEVAVVAARHAVNAVSELAAAVAARPNDEHVAAEYSKALDTAERLNAWETDTRIAATLAGLGLQDIERDRQTGSLSGGQRARVGLAWLLLNQPDILLLDEPTNHLDDSATAYLVGVLKAWRGPVLMASHDRAFLDEAATSLIDLDPIPLPHSVAETQMEEGPASGIGVTRFTGTFSDYLEVRAEARNRWERQYRDEQSELSRLRASVKDQQVVGHTDWKPRTEVRMAQKYYADRNARVVSRRVNDARARLEKLEERQVHKPPMALEFAGLTAAHELRHDSVGGPVLTASNVSFEERLSPVSMSISRGDRWLITGPNGSGKSTLLNLLAGRLTPTTGQITRVSGVRVRLLSQQIELPDPHERGPGRTATETYRDLVGLERSEQVPLSTFGLLASRDQRRPVEKLSIGQQRRLALAVLLADPPEVLLLDEPTNHFSLSLVTSLEASVAEYPGTVVIASHDRWLRERWSSERFVLG